MYLWDGIVARSNDAVSYLYFVSSSSSSFCEPGCCLIQRSTANCTDFCCAADNEGESLSASALLSLDPKRAPVVNHCRALTRSAPHFFSRYSLPSSYIASDSPPAAASLYQWIACAQFALPAYARASCSCAAGFSC